MNHKKELNAIKRGYMYKNKLIQIPTELFDKIVRLASENDRSVNKQIGFMLKGAQGKNNYS